MILKKFLKYILTSNACFGTNGSLCGISVICGICKYYLCIKIINVINKIHIHIISLYFFVYL